MKWKFFINSRERSSMCMRVWWLIAPKQVHNILGLPKWGSHSLLSIYDVPLKSVCTFWLSRPPLGVPSPTGLQPYSRPGVSCVLDYLLPLLNCLTFLAIIGQNTSAPSCLDHTVHLFLSWVLTSINLLPFSKMEVRVLLQFLRWKLKLWYVHL